MDGDNPTPPSAGRGKGFPRRVNPPVRLTYPSLGNQASYPIVPSTSRDPPDFTNHRAASTSSRSSVSVRKKEATLKAKLKIRDANKVVYEKEAALEKMKSELEEVMDAIETRRQLPPSEERDDDLLRLEETRKTLQRGVKLAESQLKTAKLVQKDEIEVINEERDLEMEKIEDEDFDDDWEDDANGEKAQARVEEWLHNPNPGGIPESVQYPPQTAPSKDELHSSGSLQQPQASTMPPPPNQHPVFMHPVFTGHSQQPITTGQPPAPTQQQVPQPPVVAGHFQQQPTFTGPPPAPPQHLPFVPHHAMNRGMGQQYPQQHPVTMPQPLPILQQHAPATVVSQSPATSDQVTMRELVNALQHVAAPRQPTFVDRDLPHFSGKPDEWLGFKAQLDRTTAEYRLTDGDNLLRLRKALRGQALEAVKYLFNSPANLPEIMSTLEFEFGRPELVIRSLIQNVESTPLPDLNKPETIMVFSRAIQSLVATIRSHAQFGYLDSTYLLDKIVERLPSSMVRAWQMFQLQQGMPKTLESFLNYICFEKTMAGMNFIPGAEDKSGNTEEKRKRGPGKVNSTTANLQGCLACDKTDHRVDKCEVFSKLSIDDRWKTAKEKRACVCCLKIGHRSRDCRGKKKCEVTGCSYSHHVLLHSNKQPKTPRSQTNQVEVEVTPEPTSPPLPSSTGSANFVTGCDGPLPIIPVKVKGPHGVFKIYALLDGGSSTSLVRKSLAHKLGLEGDELSYTYSGVTGMVTDDKARRVFYSVSGVHRGADFGVVRGAVAVDELPTSAYSIDVEAIKAKWPHLADVPAKTLQNVVPDVIIGNNNPHLILPRKLVMGKDDEPWGWRTPLGWTISGHFYGSTGSVNVMFGGGYPSNDYLHGLIKSSFSIDDLGVKVTTARGRNQDERRARGILEQTAKKVGDAWEVGLLWKEDEVTFPDTEPSAFHRLLQVEKKMRDPVYMKAYNDKIAEYLEKGFARKLTPEETVQRKPTTYIIPTFGVLNPNKPGKFRLVMDAKAKVNGVSLNDKLLTGPDLIRPLTVVLWNWRRYPIALTGDIADMFHRVRIREEDRDSQRFLWRNGDSSKPAEHYRMEVMMFGATCSPATAIFIKDKNASYYQKSYPRAVQAITSEFYVDDNLTGGYSEEDVIQLRKEINMICSAGNFKVCKWLSNSTRVLSSIPEGLRAVGAKGLIDKEEFEGERVLGLWWDPVSDAFQFRLGLHKVKEAVLKGEVPTKREMCGLIMSLFDPLGFIANFKIKGQILLQRVWSSGVSWDDEIPMDVFALWRNWICRLPELKEVQIPRCYFPSSAPPAGVQLHVFVDASSEAYSAVCYLRFSNEKEVTISDNNWSRAGDENPETLLLVGLQYGLQWLRSPSARLKEFVANRVGEIQETSDAAEWHWVPTKLNIADLATRFESDLQLGPETPWLTGPAFLREPESSWNFEEDRRSSPSTEIGQVNAVVSKVKTNCTLPVPEPGRFSSFLRLKRATAAVIRIARYFKDRNIGKPWHAGPDGSLTSRIEPADMVKAEKLLCQLAQEESFGVDVQLLRENCPVDKKGQLWRLSPMLKDGLICVDGRIKRATGVSEEVKFPIILPAHHKITELIVDQEHQRNAHQGKNTMVTNLQQKYWIVAAGHVVNSSFARCWWCKLRRLKPTTPRMAELPHFRLAHHKPAFTNCGIDLFGPLFVTVGRRQEKRWGVVVCCLTTRAVYLDVVYDLSADELIMTISRFIDTRIRPALIVCDNGTNLVGSSRKLKEAWLEIDVEKLRSYGPFQEIEWIFNPAGAPHMGGVWEVMVKLTKTCLEAILHGKAPKDSTLITALKGAENMLNSRPITAISTDPADPEPLTPNHFIRGVCDVGPSVPAREDESNVVRERWRRSQQLQELFWRRWTREFLPKLVRREKWLEKAKPLDVGDVVLMTDENTPVKCWKRAVISKVFPSSDGQVRSVEVTTRDFTTRKESVYRRPVVKLCPLGLNVGVRNRQLS